MLLIYYSWIWQLSAHIFLQTYWKLRKWLARMYRYNLMTRAKIWPVQDSVSHISCRVILPCAFIWSKLYYLIAQRNNVWIGLNVFQYKLHKSCRGSQPNPQIFILLAHVQRVMLPWDHNVYVYYNDLHSAWKSG